LDSLVSRASALLAVMAFALIPAAAQSPQAPDGDLHTIEVHAQSIEAFDPREPARTRFGKLVFRGGLVLESSDGQFGGLSALRLAADGEHFLSLSDRGYWLRGRIVYRDKVPIAIADAEMAAMLGPDGKPIKNHGWYDTESLVVDGGTAYVGIERVHEIVRFDIGKGGLRARGHPVPVPGGVKLLPSNKGLECLEMAPHSGPNGGALVAISERGLDSHGDIISFLIGGAGGVFSLKRKDDFDVSDCAATPDGRFLVLERSFSWAKGVAIRVRSVPIATIKPGALVDGEELFTADMGHQVDNMEGLSVHRDGSGALVLTMISDDNFSPIQRTLLLQFTLEP
jgi:hypothetical protein